MSRRMSIYTESFSHSNPTPSACRIGPLLMSGIINGIVKGAVAGSLEEQAALSFQRIGEVMAAAGGSLDDIVKVNVTFADITQRARTNAAWVAMFPDPQNRPSRHSPQAVLDNGKLVQCDIVAWIGA